MDQCIKNKHNPYLSLCLNKYFDLRGIQNNTNRGRINFRNIFSCFPDAMLTDQFMLDIVKYNHLNKKLQSKRLPDRECVRNHTAHLFGPDEESDDDTSESDEEQLDDKQIEDDSDDDLIDESDDDLNDKSDDRSFDSSQTEEMSESDLPFVPKPRLNDMSSSESEELVRPVKKNKKDITYRIDKSNVVVIDSDTDSEEMLKAPANNIPYGKQEEDSEDVKTEITQEDESEYKDLAGFITNNIIYNNLDKASEPKPQKRILNRSARSKRFSARLSNLKKIHKSKRN